MKITIVRHHDRVTATTAIEDGSGHVTAEGRTPAEAMGSLISKHWSEIGVEIVGEEPPTKNEAELARVLLGGYMNNDAVYGPMPLVDMLAKLPPELPLTISPIVADLLSGSLPDAMRIGTRDTLTPREWAQRFAAYRDGNFDVFIRRARTQGPRRLEVFGAHTHETWLCEVIGTQTPGYQAPAPPPQPARPKRRGRGG